MKHIGVCTLQPATHVPHELVGTYFTDRYTKGDMQLRLVDRTKGYSTFASASEHAAIGRGAAK